MELHISMIPSPKDPSWMSDDYQASLRQLGSTLKADGLEIRDVGSPSARAGCPPCVSGEWRVELGAAIAPKLVPPVGSWLQARQGRTVRLTIGEIEADVRTADELVSVINIAKFHQERREKES
jgi:hypothetical protein